MSNSLRVNKVYDSLIIFYLLGFYGLNALFLSDVPHINQLDISPSPILAFFQSYILDHVHTLFVLRLVSLTLSIFVLVAVYWLTCYIIPHHICGFLACVFVSLNISFIMAAHNNVTIMVCLLIFLLTLLYNIMHFQKLLQRNVILTGLLTGAMLLFSIYSVMMLSGFLVLYLFYTFRTGRGPLYIFNYLFFSAVSGAGAMILKIMLVIKIPELVPIWSSSDKYFTLLGLFPELKYIASPLVYIPPVQFPAILSCVGIIASLYLILKERSLEIRYPLTGILYTILGFTLALLFLRTLHPAGLLFILIPASIALSYAIINIPNKFFFTTAFILISVLMINSILAIMPFMKESYGSYLSKIHTEISEDAKILAPFSAIFAVDTGNIFFYHDIEDTETISDYISKSGIEYIVLPEDLSMAKAAEPAFKAAYGNLAYYSDLMKFVKEHCSLIDEFQSSYSMDMPEYIWQKRWEIQIFKVNEL